MLRRQVQDFLAQVSPIQKSASGQVINSEMGKDTF